MIIYTTREEQRRLAEIEAIIEPLKKERKMIYTRIRQRKFQDKQRGYA